MSILKAVGSVFDSILDYHMLPRVDEMFSLQVIPADPLELVKLAGLQEKSCAFLGPAYQRKRIYKKIRIKNFGKVSRTQAQKEAKNLGGRLLEGQAYESFLLKYPMAKETDPDIILFGTSEWNTFHKSDIIIRRVACLCKENGTWVPDLTWSEDTLYYGTWLVVFDD